MDTIAAIDADSGRNAEIYYQITQQEPNNIFLIHRKCALCQMLWILVDLPVIYLDTELACDMRLCTYIHA